jgi:hypothetical protein
VTNFLQCAVRKSNHSKRWFIISTQLAHRAWSGTRWVAASDEGNAIGYFQTTNYATREAAEAAASAAGLEVIDPDRDSEG